MNQSKQKKNVGNLQKIKQLLKQNKKGDKVKILANLEEKKSKEKKTNMSQPMWACQTCKLGHKTRINQLKARKEIEVQLQTNPM